MNIFNFNTVPNIISGAGKLNELSDICANNQISKPILITDSGIKKQGYVKKVESIFKKNNIKLIIFDDVKPDPPEKNIFDAVNIYQNNNCDAV